MKKTIIIFLAVLLPSFASAQLRVDSVGNIGLKTLESNDTLLSPVAIGYQGYQNALVSIKGSNDYLLYIMRNDSVQPSHSNYGIYVNNKNTIYHASPYGISAHTSSPHGNSVGVYGHATSDQQQAVGLRGKASSNASKSAAIMGVAETGSTSVNGTYAGYFIGDVMITGTATGTFLNSSDIRLKEDVKNLEEREEDVLSNINSLSLISYKYKQREGAQSQDVEEDEFEEDAKMPLSSENPVMKKTHFGLIAQELQQIYPELVYEQPDGYLSVNYTELIPVLMQAIKELNNKVDELSSNDQVAARSMQMETDDVEDAVSAENLVPSLSQNIPNPFSERTDIAITLPENVQKAILYIYDMTGKQLEQHEVTGRGETTMTIYADLMSNGMYIYALVADGKVITSRKMIVAK